MVHIRIIPLAFGLSWLALIWLWLFQVLPVNIESITAFVLFLLVAVVAEAVGESNDEKKSLNVTNILNNSKRN